MKYINNPLDFHQIQKLIQNKKKKLGSLGFFFKKHILKK